MRKIQIRERKSEKVVLNLDVSELSLLEILERELKLNYDLDHERHYTKIITT